jgi:hypothetical protein
VAIGSVFELAARAPSGIAVWGTGLRADPGPEQARMLLGRVGPVIAVRGPRTRDALRLPPNTPLGDPGLLAFRHVRRSPRRRGAVVIPHFTHWNTASGRQQIARAARAGYHVVDPSRTPGHVLRRVAEASLVVSASLHGVVVAHSLGVPAELLRGKDAGEPVWKYQDYFGSLSLPLEWSSWEDLAETGSPRSILERRGDRAPEIQRRAEQVGESLATALRAWQEQRHVTMGEQRHRPEAVRR